MNTKDYIPNGNWVEAKSNKEVRYITKQTTRETFEDDGKLSKQPPSIHCHYSNYRIIVKENTNT